MEEFIISTKPLPCKCCGMTWKEMEVWMDIEFPRLMIEDKKNGKDNFNPNIT
jgi:hypothetical protein